MSSAGTFKCRQSLDILDVLTASVVVLGESRQSFDIFRDLVQRYQVKGKSIHDANVVAVMVDQKIRRLATYNQGDFKRYAEITLEPLPTAAGPGSP